MNFTGGFEIEGMTLTIHTGKALGDVLVFTNVHPDSVKVKKGCLQWEDDPDFGSRNRTFSISMERVLYWESE